jgi:16S rRNA processing protein RimM
LQKQLGIFHLQASTKFMSLEGYYLIGQVTKPHGLKGEVTVLLQPDLPNDVSSLSTVYLRMNESAVPYFIQNVSLKGNKAIMRFEDVDTLEDAQSISKHQLYLPIGQRPIARKGEFYSDEVVGYTVEESLAGELGIITEVLTISAQRLLSVKYQSKDLLIPVNAPFIKEIDKSKKIMYVTLPEGYLDIA